MAAQTYRDEDGFATLVHSNAAGGVAIVKSKGNCLELIVSDGWELRGHGFKPAGPITYFWLEHDKAGSC